MKEKLLSWCVSSLRSLAVGERLRPWRWAVAVYVLCGALTRLVLLAFGDTGEGIGILPAVGTFVLGFASDIVTSLFFFLPLVLFLAVYPLSWRRHVIGRFYLLTGMAVWVFIILFVGVSEWVFWGEFGTRFNFIAVDYLVYTHEVVTNIWESYPVIPIITVLVAASLAVGWWQRHRILAPDAAGCGWRAELGAIALLLALPLGLWWTLPDSLPRPFANRYAEELSGNGIYGFFHAYNMAELDYRAFYPTLPREEAYARARRLMAGGQAPFTGAAPDDLLYRVTPAMPPREMNVVLVTVESLSAKYLARFGETRGLMPNLDRLAKQGLLLTNLYATGTRTVRGLEALSLSVPPTPGESIVRRPHNTGLQTVGQIFADHGYDVKFLYGGYALFDNMGEYFGGNGYQVVDRGDIPKERIHHENAWGVADEDIYTQALMELDSSWEAGRHAFLHVMTTSNHRPYTYPDDRIDLPSGRSGRPGAVKYTDWAMGDFIERARAKPWFDQTLFVIVADHCASSAGKTSLPLENYRIPALFYAPALVAPGEEDVLATQIDIAPTILGLLDLGYEARFFGRDLTRPAVAGPYAFVSTYESLGFLRGGRLVELDPQSKPQVFDMQGAATTVHRGDTVQDAIALYQVAADAFDAGALQRVGSRVQ